MDRAALKEYILKQYNVEPDCPWPKYPNFEVFRHAGNQKWFALAMEVPKEKLGLRENGTLDVVNFKCDPILICAMKNEPGIFPAYHMNKEKWLTAALDALRDYPAEVLRYTRGRGRLSWEPDGYAPCRHPEEVIAACGYDCDADTANTADSVFCSRGAGHTVRWDEVPGMAHIQTNVLKADEEPEEPAPVPEMEAPAIDETRFQDVSGLYDEPEAKPVRRTRKTGTAAKRTTRKKVSAEPQEELNSPAFDNFEGVDFDS